jgi:hypothetical protein
MAAESQQLSASSFWDRWPFRVAQGVYGVLLAVMGYAGGDIVRGRVFGVITGVFLGGVLIAAAVVGRRRLRSWSRRHIVLDALWLVPLLFLLVAFVRPLPLWGAALAAIAIGAVLVPWMVRRRRRWIAANSTQALGEPVG